MTAFQNFIWRAVTPNSRAIYLTITGVQSQNQLETNYYFLFVTTVKSNRNQIERVNEKIKENV